MTDLIINQNVDFQQFIRDLDSETTINAKGEGALSIRGVERFFGLNKGTFQNHLTRQSKSPSKLLERLARKGFAYQSFSFDGVPDMALGIIGNYFSRHGIETQERADFLAATGARTFLQKIKGWQAPVFEQPNPFANVGYAIDAILAPLEMDPQLQAGIRAEAIAAQCPELRPAIEATKQHLLLETKSELLSPTDIGRRFSPPMSAMKINKRLIDHGLQSKTGNKQCPYVAEGRGHDHAVLVADTAKGHAKTVQKLRWYESILELL